MARQRFQNNFSTRITQFISASDTTIHVAEEIGFVLGPEDWFMATISNGGRLEIIRVTAVSGTVWTVLRGQEGTAAVNWPLGATIEMRVTAETLDTFAQALRGFVSIYNYMTKEEIEAAVNRTETVDHTRALVTAMNDARQYGFDLYLPPGTYMRKFTPGTTITLKDGERLSVKGAGIGNTVIKDWPGFVAEGGNFARTINVTVEENATAYAVAFRDLTIDKNGASNGTPPTPFAWQQAHCLAIASPNTSEIMQVDIENVETLDKVGGGIVLATGQMHQVYVKGAIGRRFSDIFGARGDLEFQATIRSLYVESSWGRYCQSEPNTTSPLNGITPEVMFVGCTYETLEFSGYSAAPTAQTIRLSGTVARNKATFRNCRVIADNGCIFMVGSGNADYWNRCAPGSRISDSTIIVRHNPDTDTHSSLYLRSEASGGGMYLTFKNCRFVPGDGTTTSTTGYAVANLATYEGAQPYDVVFEDCEFDPLFEHVIDTYRNGIYKMIRCKLACRGFGVRVGGTGSQYGIIEFDNCDFSGVGGVLMSAVAANTLFSVRFRGYHPYSSFSFAIASGTTGNLSTGFGPYGTWYATAAPAGQGLAGMRVLIEKPAAGAPAEYVCTTPSSTTATFKITQQAAA